MTQVSITIRIDEELRNAAQAIAKDKNETLSTIIRRYLKYYVDYENSKGLCPTPRPKPTGDTTIVMNEYNHIDVIDL